MTCAHGIRKAEKGFACPYCESDAMPDYICKARFKCTACGREWTRGPRPGGVGFMDNACKCGSARMTWLNHPLNREKTA